MKEKIYKSGFWQIGSLAINVGFQLIFYAFMARELDKDSFGLIAIASTVSNLVFLIASSGLGPALIQRRNLEQGHLNATSCINISISLLLAALVFFTAPTISSFYGKSELLTAVIQVMCLSFIFQSIGMVGNFLLQKNLSFGQLFIVEASSYVISYTVGFIMAFKGQGIWSIIAVYILNPTINSLGYLFFTKKFNIRPWGFKGSHLKDLYSYGVGFSLGRITDYISNSGIMILIGRLVPMNDLGLFERSFRIMMLPGRYLGQVLQKVIFSGLAKVNNDNEKIFRYFMKGFSLMNLIMLPLSVLFILFTEEIVLILLGQKWLSAIILLRILFIPLCLRVSIRMCDSLLRAKGWVYRNTFLKFINTIVLLTFIYLGNYWGGLVGISYGVSAALVLYFVNIMFEIKKKFNKDWSVFFEPFKDGTRLALFVILFTSPPYFLLKNQLDAVFLPMLLSTIFSFGSLTFLYKINKKVFGEMFTSVIDDLSIVIKKKKNEKN